MNSLSTAVSVVSSAARGKHALVSFTALPFGPRCLLGGYVFGCLVRYCTYLKVDE